MFRQTLEQYSNRGIEHADGPYGEVKRVDDTHTRYWPSFLGRIFPARSRAWRRSLGIPVSG